MAKTHTYDGMTVYEQKRNAWAVLENRVARGEITLAEAHQQLDKIGKPESDSPALLS